MENFVICATAIIAPIISGMKKRDNARSIKSCLERNPNAFRPKIGKGRETGDDIRRHNKGCNCKRSGCLKNYCECYEVK